MLRRLEGVRMLIGLNSSLLSFVRTADQVAIHFFPLCTFFARCCFSFAYQLLDHNLKKLWEMKKRRPSIDNKFWNVHFP